MPPGTPERGKGPLERLAAKYPWPAARPDRPEDLHGWFGAGNRRLLAARLGPETRLVVELGSWLGLSTRFLLEAAPAATVVAVDHWEGSAEHRAHPEYAAKLPALYEGFLANQWAYRDRLIPLRATTLEAIAELKRLRPDLVYLDAAHDTASVTADLEAALDAFPRAAIVGDDWLWESVRAAVEAVAAKRALAIAVDENAWTLTTPPPGGGTTPM